MWRSSLLEDAYTVPVRALSRLLKRHVAWPLSEKAAITADMV
jgi:hypothetical protein